MISVMEKAARRWTIAKNSRPKVESKNPEQDIRILKGEIRRKYALMNEHILASKVLELQLKELREAKRSLEEILKPITFISISKPKKKVDKFDHLSDTELAEMAKDGRLETLIKSMAEKGLI